jgi:hypothetical protein
MRGGFRQMQVLMVNGLGAELMCFGIIIGPVKRLQLLI